ncbi:hypothetical protein DAH68_17875, partial [Sphingomonas koreensis]
TPVPAAELDSRKAVLVGSFGRRIERTGGIAGALADYVAEGVPRMRKGAARRRTRRARSNASPPPSITKPRTSRTTASARWRR